MAEPEAQDFPGAETRHELGEISLARATFGRDILDFAKRPPDPGKMLLVVGWVWVALSALFVAWVIGSILSCVLGGFLVQLKYEGYEPEELIGLAVISLLMGGVPITAGIITRGWFQRRSGLYLALTGGALTAAWIMFVVVMAFVQMEP